MKGFSRKTGNECLGRRGTIVSFAILFDVQNKYFDLESFELVEEIASAVTIQQ